MTCCVIGLVDLHAGIQRGHELGPLQGLEGVAGFDGAEQGGGAEVFGVQADERERVHGSGSPVVWAQGYVPGCSQRVRRGV